MPAFSVFYHDFGDLNQSLRQYQRRRDWRGLLEKKTITPDKTVETFPCIYIISRHATIPSKRNQDTPLPTPCSKLLWPNS